MTLNFGKGVSTLSARGVKPQATAREALFSVGGLWEGYCP